MSDLTPGGAICSALMNSRDPVFVEEIFARITQDMLPENEGWVYKAIMEANDKTLGDNRSPASVIQAAKLVKLDKHETLFDRIAKSPLDITALHAERVLASSVPLFLGVIEREHLARNMRVAFGQIMALTADETLTTEMLMDEAQAEWNRATDTHEGSYVEDGVEVADKILGEASGKIKTTGRVIKTNRQYIDTMFGGLVANKMYTVFSPPGHGKTTLMANMIVWPLIRNEIILHAVSWEDDAPSFMAGIISILTGPTIPWLRKDPRPNLPGISVARLTERGGDEPFTRDELVLLANAKLHYEGKIIRIDKGSLTVDKLRASLALTERKYRDKFIVVVVDYDQLVDGSGKDWENVADLKRFQRGALATVLKKRGCFIDGSQIDKSASSGIAKGNRSGETKITRWTQPSQVFSLSETTGGGSINQATDGGIAVFIPSKLMTGPERNGQDERFIEVVIEIEKNKITKKTGVRRAVLDTACNTILDEIAERK